MKKVFAVACSLVLLSGCSGSGMIEQRIGARVNHCGSSTPCIVKVKDLTDFSWDQLHVFAYGAQLDEIQTALGTDYPGYVEFKRRMVFLKDGRIIHREEEPTDIERPVNGQVSFVESSRDQHWSYTPDTAVFRAEKKTFAGGVYYSLTQVK